MNNIQAIMIQIQGAKIVVPMDEAEKIYEDLHKIFGDKEAQAPIIMPVVPVYPPVSPYWSIIPYYEGSTTTGAACLDGPDTSNVETYIT